MASSLPAEPTRTKQALTKMSSVFSIIRTSWLKYILIGTFLLVNVLLYKHSKNFLLDILPHLTPNTAQNTSLLERNYSLALSSTPRLSIHVSDFVPKPFPEADMEMYEKRLTSLNRPVFKDSIINPHDFHYVIMPDVSCSVRNIELVICVPISRTSTSGRQVIRETWGSYASNPYNNATLVFFVGSINGSHTYDPYQTTLLEESRQYGDILQEDYIDNYNNLSLKSVSILKWVSHYCPNAKFVLKADDDMYINVPVLLHTLRHQASLKDTPNTFVMGALQFGAQPIRTKSSKWYTSELVFKPNRYPLYASGTAYTMTGETALVLYETSLRVPLFWLEDVYITGLCAARASVKLYDNNKFSLSKPTPSGCTFKNQISGHRYSQEQIKYIHKELYDPNLKC